MQKIKSAQIIFYAQKRFPPLTLLWVHDHHGSNHRSFLSKSWLLQDLCEQVWWLFQSSLPSYACLRATVPSSHVNGNACTAWNQSGRLWVAQCHPFFRNGCWTILTINLSRMELLTHANDSVGIVSLFSSREHFTYLFWEPFVEVSYWGRGLNCAAAWLELKQHYTGKSLVDFVGEI